MGSIDDEVVYVIAQRRGESVAAVRRELKAIEERFEVDQVIIESRGDYHELG